ncbi:anaphase-promoting complex subunit 7 [Tanacetum coccineum]
MLLQSQLNRAVVKEDYEDAARIKVAIAAAATNDTVGRVMAQLNKAIKEERYKEHHSYEITLVQGWWVGGLDFPMIARTHMMEAIPSKARNLQMNLLMGKLYRYSKHIRPAITCYKECLRHCPYVIEAITALAELGVQAKDIFLLLPQTPSRSGRPPFDQFESSRSLQRYVEAQCCIASNNYKGGLELFSELLQRFPNNVHILLEMAKELQTFTSNVIGGTKLRWRHRRERKETLCRVQGNVEQRWKETLGNREKQYTKVEEYLGIKREELVKRRKRIPGNMKIKST